MTAADAARGRSRSFPLHPNFQRKNRLKNPRIEKPAATLIAAATLLAGLCRLCVVAYALVLVASFAPMDSAQTVVHRAVPLFFLVPNLFIWISMRPSGASMRGARRRNDADGSADSISCEPMNKENK